jgi:hypothetical protein
VEEEINLQTSSKSTEQIIEEMTLFDDELMSLVFDGNIAATELLLRIILERDDIKVISVTGQRELKNPVVGGRKIRLDILACDNTGRYFNIEVQRRKKGSGFRRARFHSSMIDTRMLNEKQEFRELLDSYVIFITEKDKIGKGLPVYHIERVIMETNELVGDGSHIIYVNGSYQGDDPIGKLIHDLHCKNSNDIYYHELADGVRHFKESEGGRKVMSDAVREYAEAAAKEAEFKNSENIAIKMLRAGKYALDEIANLTDLSLEHVKKLQNNI